MHDEHTGPACVAFWRVSYDSFNWNFMGKLTQIHADRYTYVYVYVELVEGICRAATSFSEFFSRIIWWPDQQKPFRFLTLTLMLTSFINQLALYIFFLYIYGILVVLSSVARLPLSLSISPGLSGQFDAWLMFLQLTLGDSERSPQTITITIVKHVVRLFAIHSSLFLPG